MGKAEVIEILKKEPDRWFTAKEIAAQSETNESTCAASLRKLRADKAIHHKYTKHGTYHLILYKYKK